MTDKLIEALLGCMGRTDCRKCPILGQCNGTFDSALRVTVEHIKAQATENATLRAQLSEKDEQLAAAVEDLRGLCWCCAHGKKWDKAPAWSNMTTCEHIRERGSLAVGGGKAGKDCPHWEYRGPQEAGEVEQC